MKIRIKDSSIRLRLSKSDVNTLSSEGCILAECQIAPKNTLKYMISIAEKDEIEVKLKYHTIDVKIPYAQLQKFFQDEEIGIQHTVDNGQNKGLFILVEKDFQCLVPRSHEDETNLYTNPQANAK